MSMASLGTFLFIIVLLLFSLGNAKTFVTVDCKAENVGQYGKPTMLECVVHFNVPDVNIVFVNWKKEDVDKLVLAYNGWDSISTHEEPGYRFAEEHWNSSNRNISLLITNTEMAHAGNYICTVVTDRGDDSNSINLKVTAKYNKPTILPSGKKDLECHSDGGYPEGQLRWIVDGDSWKEIIKTDVKKSESGTYNLSSRLTLTKDSQFSKFTCEVLNASGEKENEDTFEIQQPPLDQLGRGSDPQKSHAAVVAPLVVIGSLIVGLLLVVLFIRRRSRQARRPSATPLMRDPQVCRCEFDAEQGGDQEMVGECEEKVGLKE